MPGFTGHARIAAVRRLIVRLRRRADVLVVELRGHGRSAGRSTMGVEEVADVAAGVDWGRSQGYERVVTVGFSFGGAVVLCHAALRKTVDAVAAVSTPSRWFVRDTPIMRALHVLVESLPGRVVARTVYKVRLAPLTSDIPPSPLELMPRIAPTPVLLVHGLIDHYFPIEHPLALAAAAGDNATVWLEPDFAHAENRLPVALADRLGRWLSEAAAPVNR
ncbi:alpha/beta hydrolase family protein [Cryptosporangium sp. NPDC048952]|uniref:alpha/beta hydrolase family protein n=1 Tax=Cryptosporangium sp. NPDC048952 TaxID=3363961 RepID=UPI0037206E72